MRLHASIRRQQSRRPTPVATTPRRTASTISRATIAIRRPNPRSRSQLSSSEHHPDARSGRFGASVAYGERETSMSSHTFKHRRIAAALIASLAVSAAGFAGEPGFLPNMAAFPNPTGVAATFSTMGRVALDGPFFQSLGSNGRSCGSCHQPSDGWTVVPGHLRERFDATAGTNPIFSHRRRFQFTACRRLDGRRAAQRL